MARPCLALPEIEDHRAETADRRLRGDHPVEFPRGDDHPEMCARPRGGLHLRRETRTGYAADRAGASRTRGAGGRAEGCLNIITGDAVAIGKVFTTHPAVRFVGFTGSTPVGKLLMQQAASTVKKVALELGGNAPFIVFDDADLDAAVAGAVTAKFRNMGQTCVCTNRLFVQAGIHDRFVEAFGKAVAALKVGPGDAEGVVQGPLINARAIDKVESHVADATAQGARVVTGGKPSRAWRHFLHADRSRRSIHRDEGRAGGNLRPCGGGVPLRERGGGDPPRE